MTTQQYYFPYFFDLAIFNDSLMTFGLFAKQSINSKTQLPDRLDIYQLETKNSLLTIPFGVTLTISNDAIIYWTMEYDTIDLTKFDLNLPADIQGAKTERLDLRQFALGQNEFKSSLDINELVLFARKTELKYNQDYYEKFVIVLIDKQKLEIIPFDWFNKTGGDYGYVWPAVARYDSNNRKLYGRGMRMNDFVIEI